MLKRECVYLSLVAPIVQQEPLGVIWLAFDEGLTGRVASNDWPTTVASVAVVVKWVRQVVILSSSRLLTLYRPRNLELADILPFRVGG